jgi:N-acetylneuraminic acid mutarotase
MIGKDTNSNPTQYRVWVANEPDFEAQFYQGLKSGSNDLIDIVAYQIDDDIIADFNLPDPLNWNIVKKVLPSTVADSQLAIIDGYSYLFGGKLSAKIYRADNNNPADWIDVNANLPLPLYGSQLAIIGDRLYLFGGNDGEPTDIVISAHIDDPLVWISHGSCLPVKISNSQLAIIGNYIYLFGGYLYDGSTDKILRAPVTNPLQWEDTGSVLPVPLYGSQIAILNDYVYLFGGLSVIDEPVDRIYMAPINNPTNWYFSNYLPHPIANGQFVAIGDKGYLFTSGEVSSTPRSQGTRILRCNLSTPTQWVDTLHTIPGEITQSQVGIIGDRIFLFGGVGSSLIFVADAKIKFNIYSPTVTNYGNTTRTLFNNTENRLELFKVLGFPYWKTDYGS